MTTKIDAYRAELRRLADWEPFLRQESHLPGPRSNLELAQAVAEEGDAACFEQLLSYDAGRAPTNTPDEFLAVCGVLGLGRLLTAGQHELLPRLRDLAVITTLLARHTGAAIALRAGASAMVVGTHGNLRALTLQHWESAVDHAFWSRLTMPDSYALTLDDEQPPPVVHLWNAGDRFMPA